MISINQKILNFTISFICFFLLSACQTFEKEQQKSIEKVEIAILMPMTGANSLLGQQYNKLIKMGLEDGVQTNINVTSYDGADERQVLAAMEKIVARQTKIILGPLYSALTSLIANKAKNNDIVMITMSNDPALADKKLFVFGHAPLKQLDKIINYFLDHDYKNFIALLPYGHHSQTVSQIIQNTVNQKNATLVRTEFYSDNPESISKSLEIISQAVDNLNEMDENAVKPVIYIADDTKNLNLLFNAIHKSNLDKKAIITGDNRINLPNQHVDFIFTGSLNNLNSNVPDKVSKLGINHLSFMHLMAYDLGKMVADSIGREFTEQAFLARLNSEEPYIGISANIKIIDSIVQRDYDVIKYYEGIYSTLSKN